MYITESRQVLQTKQQTANPFTFASLFLQSKSDDPFYVENPIGLCVVELIGAMAEEIRILELFLFPCDKTRVINAIFSVYDDLPFKQLAIDLDTMKFLNQDREYSRKVDERNVKHKKSPSFFAVQSVENKELSIYQQGIVKSLLNAKQITNNPYLEILPNGKPNEIGQRNLASIAQYGVSPLAQAFAVATEQAVKMRNYLNREIREKSKQSQTKETKEGLRLSNQGFIY